MSKRLILLLVVILLGTTFIAPVTAQPGDELTAPPQVQAAEPAPPVNELIKGMTPDRIYAACKVQQGLGHGTGTVLNDTFVLTAYHVVDNDQPITVTLPYDDRPISATIEVHGDDEMLDYAVLRLDKKAPTSGDGALLPPGMRREPVRVRYYLPMATMEEFSELRTGERAYVAGYPLKWPLHLTEGDICSYSEGFVTTSVPITNGNSGSAVVIGARNPRIFGVMVRVAMARGAGQINHISLMTRLDRIHEDLKKQERTYVFTGLDVPAETPKEKEEAQPDPFMPGPGSPWGNPFPDPRRGYQNFNPHRPTMLIEDIGNGDIEQALLKHIETALAAGR